MWCSVVWCVVCEVVSVALRALHFHVRCVGVCLVLCCAVSCCVQGRFRGDSGIVFSGSVCCVVLCVVR